MKPRIIICVHGGVVTEVKANCQVNVDVLDYDNIDEEGENTATELEQEYDDLPEVVY